MEQPAPAYAGEEPYAFVSYSHQDEALVYREIRWLQDHGVNLWYDTHIQAGSEWSDALADAISGCTRFLYFITPNSVSSENCRRELNHAITEGRSILAVHLLETEVPGGIRLNLNNRQAILKQRLTPEVYRSTLLGALATDSAGPETEPAASSSSRWSIWLVSAIAAMLLVAVSAIWLVQRSPEQRGKGSNLLDRSIAVLPLTVVGEDPVAVSLAEALTEEIRATVAGYQELRSVAQLDEANSPTPDASYVLRGSVQRVGENLRLRVGLVRSDDLDTVWAHTLERPASEGASWAPDVAITVGRMLRRRIVVDQECEPVRRATQVQEAADAFCAAVAESYGGLRGSGSDSNLALRQALRAIALDPSIADAHVYVGLNYVWLGETDQMDWREAAREAREALDRSLALTSNNPRAFSLKGRIESLEMNYPEAQLSLGEAIARDPLLPRAGPDHGRLALVAYAIGRLDEALEHQRRAVHIDDTNATQYAVLSLLLRSRGDFREAMEAADTGLELVDTGLARVALFIHKIESLNALGERQKANDVMNEAIASTGSEWKFVLAGTFASIGRMEEAQQILAALERLDDPPVFLMAQTYAQLDDDRAFDWIRRGIEGHVGLVVWYLREHPVYSILRKDPRWIEIISLLETEEALGSSLENHRT